MTGRRGRRPGRPDTRGAVLAAARAVFAELGYQGASIRRIATDAGVDPALVHHYFGNKDELFLAALRLPVNPARLVPQVVAGGADGFGERLVRTFLAVWDGPAGPAALVALRGVLSHPTSAAMLRDFLTGRVLRQVMDTLRVDDGRLRGSLIASQLIGLATARYVLAVEPLAGLPAERVAALVGPTVQRYLTAELPDR